MKENKKSPFVVFENVKITKKQQEEIENLLARYSNEKGGKVVMLSEETPSFTVIRHVFFEQSKEADKIFLQKNARGQLNFVLEGIKQKHFGKNAFESNECLLEQLSSFYYDWQGQLFTKLEEKSFSGVFAECCRSLHSKLVAGVVNGNEKNIHLYYGYMNGNLAISNAESILSALCEEIWEIKDNTFIEYNFNTQMMAFHSIKSIDKKKEKKRKRKKLKKELENIQQQLEILTKNMADLQEQLKLSKSLTDDGR